MTRNEGRVRSLPGVSMNRATIGIAFATLFVGQITILGKVGGLEEVSDLYKVVVWLVIINVFWPQIQYGVFRAAELLSNRFGSEVEA